jgi:diguanylate cyclase (GGDEF)-like protein
VTERSTTGFRLACAAAGLVPLAYAGFRFLDVDRSVVGAIGAVLMILASGAAAVICFRQSKGSSGPRFWWLFTAYCVLWMCGQIVWSYNEVVLGRMMPFPSYADIGYLGGAAFGVLAALSLPVRDHAITRFRAVLDGLLVVLPLLFVAWAFSLGPMIEHHSGSPGVVLGFAYPIVDALVLTIVVTMLSRIGILLRPTTYLLLVGLACIGVADAAFAYRAAAGTYETGTLIDVGWICGFLLLCAGSQAKRPRPGPTEPRPIVTPPERTALLAPYASFVPMLATAGWLIATKGVLEVPLMLIGFVATVAMIARQIVLLLESERRAREMAHRAAFDSLTGLWNRDRFRDELDRAVHEDEVAAILYLDLDDFKDVNDSYGHSAGDALLRVIADVIASCTRAGDGAARLGGDEFAVLLRTRPHTAEVVAVAERIASAVRDEALQTSRVGVGLSIGIAQQVHDSTAETLLRDADLAMYAAKRNGKNRYELYEPHMHAGVLERLDLNRQLEHALERQEFRLFFQPKFDLTSGEVVGAEALLRWQHPERGFVRPLEFIPAAEESGLIVPIGRWVMESACRLASRLRAEQLVSSDFDLCVNVAPRQLQEERFVDDVARALASSRLPSHHLVVELTESALIDDEQALTRLVDLKGLGVRIAVDDFGTGYSSLSYLHRFPVDILKIDRSFVSEVDRGMERQAMAKAIIVLAETLHLTTVAEGIERESQADQLRALGCHRGQGYLLAEPMSEHEFIGFLAGLGEPGASGAQPSGIASHH